MKVEQLGLNKTLVTSKEMELGDLVVGLLIGLLKGLVRAGRLARISFIRANFRGIEPRWEIRRSG